MNILGIFLIGYEYSEGVSSGAETALEQGNDFTND